MIKSTGLAGLCAALLLTMTPEAMAQNASRYSAPPAVTLSPDLTGPWVLQLSRKPSQNGRRAAELASPPVRERPALRQSVSAFAVPALEPVRRQVEPAPDPQPRARSSEQQQKKKNDYDPRYEMQIVDYVSNEKPGTIIIDTSERFLYLIESDGKARRYGVGVGREGFEWSGSNRISRKAEWPGWTPPPEMIARERKRGKILPAHMPGGPENPLGARALYLGDTLYRIHGTNQPWSIGQAVSSGCIRMRNEDVIDLYERVRIGAKVVVS